MRHQPLRQPAVIPNPTHQSEAFLPATTRKRRVDALQPREPIMHRPIRHSAEVTGIALRYFVVWPALAREAALVVVVRPISLRGRGLE
jgi:hypothetical protein